MIFEPRYERFLGACQDITRRRDLLAKPVIEREILAEVGPSVPNDALLSHIMAEALMRRVDRALVERKNIYLEKFEIAQLDLFYLMARAYPQVPASHLIANHFLAHELRKHRDASLLEVGIGKGLQIAALLDRLAEDPGALRSLRVVAVDANEENLAESTRALRDKRVPFALEACTVHKLVEACTPADWDGIADLLRLKVAALVVNSAFSLHHTLPGTRRHDVRTDILRRIKALSPRLFTLVEPSANHDIEHLAKRFSACWEHFGTVFDLIDESDLDAPSRFVIKEKFFGREIRDIFGTSDVFRCERHEPYESWLFRLAKAGFVPYERVDVPLALPRYCNAVLGDGLTRLGYRDLALIAVFAYRCTGERDPRDA